MNSLQNSCFLAYATDESNNFKKKTNLDLMRELGVKL